MVPEDLCLQSMLRFRLEEFVLQKLRTWQICRAVKLKSSLFCFFLKKSLDAPQVKYSLTEQWQLSVRPKWVVKVCLVSPLVFQLTGPKALCSCQDLRRWISASDPPFAFVCETGGQFRVNLCVTKPKEAPSKWVRGSESWEKEFELCFTSGARSWVFVREVPPACAAWHISGGGGGKGTGQGGQTMTQTASLCWKSRQNSSFF